MAPEVFFITGTSTGFGHELVKKCLAEGDRVVATARDSSKLRFDGATEHNYIAVDCDVTSEASIRNAFQQALTAFGRVDVVCNNAGYGLSGEFESLSDRQIRTQMEVNFFGVLNVTREALRIMREVNKPAEGKIQQITSICGQVGAPTMSMYCASKWAVEGFTEALSNELKPEWNIQLTCIEPGGSRTDWAGRSMVFGEKKNPAYDHINVEERWSKMNGTQAGDPIKGAKAFWDIAKMKDPPLRLVLGSDAYQRMMAKIKTYGDLYPRYEELSNSADYDDYRRPSRNPVKTGLFAEIGNARQSAIAFLINFQSITCRFRRTAVEQTLLLPCKAYLDCVDLDLEQ